MSTTSVMYLPDWMPELFDNGNFDYSNYRQAEQDIIKPALERIGLTNIHFRTAEQDGFSPLSREVWYTDPHTNEQRCAWYG